MIVKCTPNFPVFSVGRNQHKFLICLREKVFMCNILIEYSVVHPESTLKQDYSTKIWTLFFLDFIWKSRALFETWFGFVICTFFDNILS